MILRPVSPASPCGNRTEHNYPGYSLKIWPSTTHLGASDDKTATGLQVVNGVIIQIDAGDHGFDNLLLQGLSHLLQANILIMLDRDDNCVHTHRKHGAAVLAVLDSDLRGEDV